MEGPSEKQKNLLVEVAILWGGRRKVALNG